MPPGAGSEGSVYAKYILRTKPDAKIAVLYSNADDGKEWLLGVHDGLGEKASTMIVKEVSYEYTDPATIDLQFVALQSSGADAFINLAVGKFATHAIRKAYDIDWHPLQFIPDASLCLFRWRV
jgi:branched-chain amino acid transport system substrate-binding protein